MDQRRPRNILFVCTGNTCRSPMAEAIARAMVSESAGGDRSVNIFSAGVSAAEGGPITPEAAESLRRLGVTPPVHRSVRVTSGMIEGADLVIAMTRGHVDRILSMAPGARVITLDPTGADVPDPIGQSQSVYDEASKEIRRLVGLRLRDILG